jgi:hypothetical protein
LSWFKEFPTQVQATEFTISPMMKSTGHDDENRMPFEQGLPHMGIQPLPDKWTPLEALVITKCLDEDGDSTWCYRTTSVPNREELLGALIVHQDLLRRELLAEWPDDKD